MSAIAASGRPVWFLAAASTRLSVRLLHPRTAVVELAAEEHEGVDLPLGDLLLVAAQVVGEADARRGRLLHLAQVLEVGRAGHVAGRDHGRPDVRRAADRVEAGV